MAAITISQLNILIQAQTEQLRADLAKANRSIDNLRSKASAGKRGGGLLAQATADAKALLPKLGLIAAAFAVIAGARFGIGLAAQAEQTEIAFTTMLGSAERAKSLLAELGQLAATTPFQTDEVKKAAQNLLSFGVAAGDIIERMRTLGDIAAVSSASIGELASIFGKMKSSGVVALGDLNQLGDRGIPIFETLKKQLDLTGAELRKFVSTGQLGFEDVLQAMETMTSEGGIFFEGAEKASKSLSGAWSTLTSNIGELAKAFGQVLLPTLTAAVQALNSLVTGTLKLLGRGGAVDQGVETTKKLNKSLKETTAGAKDAAAATKEMEEATKEAAKEQEKLREAGRRLFEQTRTPQERAIARLAEFKKLLQLGVINADTYARAVKGITDEFDKAGKAAKSLGLAGVSAATRRSGGFSAVQAAQRANREAVQLAKQQRDLAEERNRLLTELVAAADRGGVNIVENRF